MTRRRRRITVTGNPWTIIPVERTCWHVTEPPAHLRYRVTAHYWDDDPIPWPLPVIAITIRNHYGEVIATNGWHPAAVRHIYQIRITG